MWVWRGVNKYEFTEVLIKDKFEGFKIDYLTDKDAWWPYAVDSEGDE